MDIFRAFYFLSLRPYGYLKYYASESVCSSVMKVEENGYCHLRPYLVFSLLLCVLYNLNLGSFLGFNFSPYLFLNWSQTITSIFSLFSLQCKEFFKWLTDWQIVENWIWQIISHWLSCWTWSGSSICQWHNNVISPPSWNEIPLFYTICK